MKEFSKNPIQRSTTSNHGKKNRSQVSDTRILTKLFNFGRFSRKEKFIEKKF